MKLVTYAARGDTRVGVLQSDGQVYPTAYRDMVDAIMDARIEPGTRPVPNPDLRLLAPVRRPGVILGSGVNYASHREENPDAVMPAVPGFFAKLPSSVVGPGDAIRIPYPDAHTDYEVELAVVIGRRGRGVDEATALDHVFGVTIVNDVSERRLQFSSNGTDLGKGCDTFCPMGPCIVTLDEIDAQALTLSSWVNGEIRQRSTTADMLFSISRLVAHASRYTTLWPGDVISTGTPAGCGTFRRPPVWLAPGDVVRLEIEGIGELVNPVVAGWAADASI